MEEMKLSSTEVKQVQQSLKEMEFHFSDLKAQQSEAKNSIDNIPVFNTVVKRIKALASEILKITDSENQEEFTNAQTLSHIKSMVSQQNSSPGRVKNGSGGGMTSEYELRIESLFSKMKKTFPTETINSRIQVGVPSLDQKKTMNKGCQKKDDRMDELKVLSLDVLELKSLNYQVSQLWDLSLGKLMKCDVIIENEPLILNEDNQLVISCHSEGKKDQRILLRQRAEISLLNSDNKMIYTSSPTNNLYSDVVYSSGSFYYFETKTGVWRQKIGQSSPEKWLRVKGSTLIGRTLITGLCGRALVINDKMSKITVAQIKDNGNLGSKLSIGMPSGSQIVDHKIVGPSEDQVAVLTKDWKLIIAEFNLKTAQSSVIVHQKISSRRGENCCTLAVCPKSKYFVVHSATSSWVASSISVFEREKRKLVFKNRIVGGFRDKEPYLHTLSMFGYYGTSIFLSGITKGTTDSRVFVICYDTITQEVTILNNLTQEIQAAGIYHLKKEGTSLVGIDKKTRKVKINFYLP